MKRIIITSYTDVLCSWCWATEPAYRALETRFPDEIEFRYVYGGMIRNLDDFKEGGAWDQELTPADANRLTMGHWQEGVRLHHMPIQAEGFSLFTENPASQSSMPQGLAFKAAQVANPELANRYLRRIREATVAEAQRTHERAVQLQLAEDVGLDVAAFSAALDDGSAQRKLNADLMLTHSQGVAVFPTFNIKTERAREGILTGFNRWEDFANAISHLTDGELQPVAAPWDEAELEYLFYKTPRLTHEELFQAFDFEKRSDLDERLADLQARNIISKRAVGESFIYQMN